MPATTPRGYPYPLPTEPVAEGAQAIRNLAESADAKVGWVPLGEIDLMAATSFTAIPTIYDHLRLFVRGRSAWAGQPNDNLRLRTNDIATASYYGSTVYGANNAPGSVTFVGASSAYIGSVPAGAGAGQHLGISDVLIMDYRSGAPIYLVGHSYSIGAAVQASMRADSFGSGLPAAPVTKITLFPENGAFATTSGINPRAWLYGIVGFP